MNDEIREILNKLKSNNYPFGIATIDINKLLDYITNLQQENERLKKELNCKEYFSSTMPEDTEFVILTKNNYDRQQKDIQLELIDYKSKIEKAVEYNYELQERYCHSALYDELVASKVYEITEKELNILQNGGDGE